ncbi:MAG: L-2-hydroxyglutarate oxidase [Phycisphaerae bacterium]
MTKQFDCLLLGGIDPVATRWRGESIEQADVAIVGAGIVGLATAMALSKRPEVSVAVVEAEGHVAAHQSGHNSGVIHSGLYYTPGSSKAQLCATGREAMFRFCEKRGVPFRQCGKLVVAVNERQRVQLDRIEQTGRANGLRGLRRVNGEQLREIEPHVSGLAGLFVAETGVVDFRKVALSMAEVVRGAGHRVRLGSRMIRARQRGGTIVLETTSGAIESKLLINCGGLQADRVAVRCGVDPPLRIVPFRGEYWRLVPSRRDLVAGLIYPVPDPDLPFLGVHLTRSIDDEVNGGPNAVLAFSRRGYGRMSFSLRDTLASFHYRGFRKMARGHWRTAVSEWRRSLSKRIFAREVRTLVPAIRDEDLERGGVGIRAQAVGPTGALVGDFCIEQAPRMIHVLNAPSPAATASIAIGEHIAALAQQHLK